PILVTEARATAALQGAPRLGGVCRFSRLNVTGGPVVEQASPEHVVLGFAERGRLSLRLAGTDEDFQCQFIVKRRARGILRGRFSRGEHLAPWPVHPVPRNPNARCAAVVSDGNPPKVWGERLFRPEETADVHGVMNRGVEIGVAADARRNRVLGL